MLKKLSGYLLDRKFRFTLYPDKLHIINYEEMLSVSDMEISILTSEGKVFVYGDNLALMKLIEGEALLSGKIKKIEVDFHD